jgi:hypothetical protein
MWKRVYRGVFEIQDTAYRHLLAQEIEVFFAVAQTLLGGAELVCEELFGFGDWVGEHDVGLRVCVSGFGRLWVFKEWSSFLV